MNWSGYGVNHSIIYLSLKIKHQVRAKELVKVCLVYYEQVSEKLYFIVNKEVVNSNLKELIKVQVKAGKNLNYSY